MAEKEELRATCAARIEEYATEMSKQTAAARDAAIEAQKQASLVHGAHVKTQELEYELHEERRRRIELERNISHMELAKQTIADFTADAEASVLRSIQAQRDANVELQRLRVEKHDLHGQLSASKIHPARRRRLLQRMIRRSARMKVGAVNSPPRSICIKLFAVEVPKRSLRVIRARVGIV